MRGWFGPRLVVLLLAAATLAGCGGRGPEPPPPPGIRTPDVVGVIVAYDRSSCDLTRYTLDTGDEVEVVARQWDFEYECEGALWSPTPNMAATKPDANITGVVPPGGEVSDGGLLLYGEDEFGEWYAVARPGWDDCPFTIQAGAFDDGGFIHFSSGLRLPKADGFFIVDDWLDEPFPLRPEDTMCLTADAEVQAVWEIWVPY